MSAKSHIGFKARAEWAEVRKHMRKEVSRVFEDLEAGAIDEEDLAKLRNFCMQSLMLLSKVDQRTWERAKEQADLAGYLHEQSFSEGPTMFVTEYLTRGSDGAELVRVSPARWPEWAGSLRGLITT